MSTNTPKKEFSFKIGADPEFTIILQNKRVDAQATMSEILKGKSEFREGSMGFNVGTSGNIGWDGASQTGEIRPAPSNHPMEVVKNLGNMFSAFGKYMSIFELSTLSQHASIGGHIHLEAENNWSTQKQKSIHAQIISFYMPILMSENKINLALRIRQGYGSMTDYRFESKGHNPDGSTVKTYELRCPSAEWLTCPKVANAVLSYIGVVYNEIINHPRSIKKCSELLLKSDKQTEAFQTLALQEYDILNNALLKNIKKNIKNFDMYPAFKEEVDFILNPKAVIKEKAKYNYDISLGWNIRKNTDKITKREITSEAKFKEKIKNKDADVISRMLQIDYNDDAKVNEFVNALSLRAGAFNWKLSKQYFVFGLKRGIKDIIAKDCKGNFLTGSEQIKTRDDYTLITRAFEKMYNKYAETGSTPNLMTIDFKTGKTISMRDNVIIIGLPYEMRMEGKTKDFIDTIWKIENNTLKQSALNTDNLTNDIGEIEKARLERETANGTEETEIPQNAIVIDRGGSQSARNQQRTLVAMNDEERNMPIDISTMVERAITNQPNHN